MERSKRESLNVRMKHGDDDEMNKAQLEPQCVHKESSTDKGNSNNWEETLQTNKQRALTSLQLLFSWVCTCFRFAATWNMLLCLLFCFVSLIQSSSVFPRIHFSPVSEFLVLVHTAKTGLLRCCLYNFSGVVGVTWKSKMSLRGDDRTKHDIYSSMGRSSDSTPSSSACTINKASTPVNMDGLSLEIVASFACLWYERWGDADIWL